MQVLIIKLRSANTNEARQYRKASKALLVLIPLFGITYLIILTGPTEGVSSYIFAIARALLISTQVIYTKHIINLLKLIAQHLNICINLFSGIFCVTVILFFKFRSKIGFTTTFS